MKVYTASGARFASAEDAEAAAEGMPDGFLMCRELSHGWVPFDASLDHGIVQRIVRCTRCDTRRVMEINSKNGEIVSSRYVYAEGYLIKGLGRVAGDAKGALRLASLGRTLKLPGVR